MPDIKTTADIGFEKQIWDAACVLRGNMDASEYKNIVLGLIFLKYISDRFEERYQQLVDEGDGFEEDIDESFVLGGGPGGQKTNKTSSVVRLSHGPSGLMVRCGETRSRETNRWLARRMLAETILERERRRKSSARQAAEKIRRQKRRRSRRQKQKMLADKHARAEVKKSRRRVDPDDE